MNINPSVEALARKEKSIAILKARQIPFAQHLPVIEESIKTNLRPKDEIAHRAIALCLVAVKGEGLEQDKVKELIKRYGAESFFTPAERKFIENENPTEADRIKFSWCYESFWTLLWALGYVETLEYPDAVCDVPKAVTILKGKSTEDFRLGAKLRDKSSILDEADLIYRYHWAIVDGRLKGKAAAPAELHSGIVQERHRALNWLIGYMNQDWDNITTDT